MMSSRVTCLVLVTLMSLISASFPSIALVIPSMPFAAAATPSSAAPLQPPSTIAATVANGINLYEFNGSEAAATLGVANFSDVNQFEVTDSDGVPVMNPRAPSNDSAVRIAPVDKYPSFATRVDMILSTPVTVYSLDTLSTDLTLESSSSSDNNTRFEISKQWSIPAAATVNTTSSRVAGSVADRYRVSIPAIEMKPTSSATLSNLILEGPQLEVRCETCFWNGTTDTAAELHFEGRIVSMLPGLNVATTIPTYLAADATLTIRADTGVSFGGGLLLARNSNLTQPATATALAPLLYTPVLILGDGAEMGLFRVTLAPSEAGRRGLLVLSSTSKLMASLNIGSSDIILSGRLDGSRTIELSDDINLEVNNLKTNLTVHGGSIMIRGYTQPSGSNTIIRCQPSTAAFGSNLIINGSGNLAACELIMDRRTLDPFGQIVWHPNSSLHNIRYCGGISQTFEAGQYIWSNSIIDQSDYDPSLSTYFNSRVNQNATVTIMGEVALIGGIYTNNGLIRFSNVTNSVLVLNQLRLNLATGSLLGSGMNDTLNVSCSMLSATDPSTLGVSLRLILNTCSKPSTSTLQFTGPFQAISSYDRRSLTVSAGDQLGYEFIVKCYSAEFSQTPVSMDITAVGSVILSFLDIKISGNIRTTSWLSSATPFTLASGSSLTIINGAFYMPFGVAIIRGQMSALHANNAAIYLGGGRDIQNDQYQFTTLTVATDASLMASIHMVTMNNKTAPTTIRMNTGSSIAGRLSGTGEVILGGGVTIPSGHKLIISDNVTLTWSSTTLLYMSDNSVLELWNSSSISIDTRALQCGRNTSIIIRDRSTIRFAQGPDFGMSGSTCRYLSENGLVIPELSSRLNTTLHASGDIGFRRVELLKFASLTIAARNAVFDGETATYMDVQVLPTTIRPTLVFGACTNSTFNMNAAIDMQYRSVPSYGINGTTSDQCGTPTVTFRGAVRLGGDARSPGNGLRAYVPISIRFQLRKTDEVGGDFINFAGQQSTIQGGIAPNIVISSTIIPVSNLRFVNWPITIVQQGFEVYNTALTLQNSNITCTSSCSFTNRASTQWGTINMMNGSVIDTGPFTWTHTGFINMSPDSRLRIGGFGSRIASGFIRAPSAVIEVVSGLELMGGELVGELSRPVHLNMVGQNQHPLSVQNCRLNRVHISNPTSGISIYFEEVSAPEHVQIVTAGAIYLANSVSNGVEWNSVRVIAPAMKAELASSSGPWRVTNGNFTVNTFEISGYCQLRADSLFLLSSPSVASKMLISSKAQLTVVQVVSDAAISVNGGTIQFSIPGQLTARNGLDVGTDSSSAHLYFPINSGAILRVDGPFYLREAATWTLGLDPTMPGGGLPLVVFQDAFIFGTILINLKYPYDTFDVPEIDYRICFASSYSWNRKFTVPRGEIVVAGNYLVYRAGPKPERPVPSSPSSSVPLIIGLTAGAILLVSLVICIRRYKQRRSAHYGMMVDIEGSAAGNGHGSGHGGTHEDGAMMVYQPPIVPTASPAPVAVTAAAVVPSVSVTMVAETHPNIVYAAHGVDEDDDAPEPAAIIVGDT